MWCRLDMRNLLASHVLRTMVFSLFACADLQGDKLNFELGFNGRPTLHDLHVRIVEVFTVALRECGDADSFIVQTIVIHDRSNDVWSELVSAEQLATNAQLYIFQPHKDDDLSKPLPRPLLPPSAIAPSREETIARSHSRLVTRSPASAGRLPASTSASMRTDRGARSSSVRGVPLSATLSDVVRGDGELDALGLFAALDTDQDGIVTLRSLFDAMEAAGMDTSPAAVGDTFAFGDRHINGVEFQKFGAAFPAVVRELRQRMPAASSSAPLSPPTHRPPPRPNGHMTPPARAHIRRRGPPDSPLAPLHSLDSRVAPSLHDRPSLVALTAPLSALDARDLDGVEADLLILLDEVRRRRAAFLG
jgi:hypothetical protein